MASLKPVIRPSQVKIDKKCNIKIRICHNRKVAYLKTQWNIEPKFMNEDGTINNKYPGQLKLNLALYGLLSELNGQLESIGKDINYMDIHTLVAKLKRHEESGESIIKYMQERIKTLRSERRMSYADTYEATIKHMKDFTEKDDIAFREITLDFLQRFERYLVKAKKKPNTIRIYINNIRAVFNHAIDNDVIKQELFPFRKFKTRSEHTEKRNLDAAEIKKLLKLKLQPAHQKALDLFMLSFYMGGINFKDMLSLTHKNVFKGRVTYRRAKTGQNISIKLWPETIRLVKKYEGKDMLLHFSEDINDKRKTVQYKDVVKQTNKMLKKIAAKAKLNIPLSTYYARHSVATIAYSKGIPEATISEILGHKYGNPMTNVYISRDYKKADAALRKVIDAVVK